MQKSCNKYLIERNKDKFNKLGYTLFLDNKELNTLKNILNKEHINYNTYESYQDCDYKCLYKDVIPNVVCVEIITDGILKHSDIMGALYNFNISEDYIGDIIINENKYYFLSMKEVLHCFEDLKMIGKYNVELKVVDIPIYERHYIDLEYIVSSNRIDTVISRITNINRKDINDLINKKDVILNYDILTNKSYCLKENDVFSIRKYGKYKYLGISKTTKKDNIVIKLNKYD